MRCAADVGGAGQEVATRDRVIRRPKKKGIGYYDSRERAVSSAYAAVRKRRWMNAKVQE